MQGAGVAAMFVCLGAMLFVLLVALFNGRIGRLAGLALLASYTLYLVVLALG